MPLIPGKSDTAKAENIRELRKAGHPEPQAIAIAMHHAEQAGQHTAMAGVHRDAATAALQPTGDEGDPATPEVTNVPAAIKPKAKVAKPAVKTAPHAAKPAAAKPPKPTIKAGK